MTTTPYSDLIKIVRPFVGAKLNPTLDKDGRIMPRNVAIDILCEWGQRMDADVREVSESGITSFFYSGCDVFFWHQIEAITIRSVDDLGDTVAARSYYSSNLRVNATVAPVDGPEFDLAASHLAKMSRKSRAAIEIWWQDLSERN